MDDKEMSTREDVRKPPFSFWSGFLQGFSVSSFTGEALIPLRYHGGEGVRGDWKVVGGDMRRAMRKFNERRSA